MTHFGQNLWLVAAEIAYMRSEEFEPYELVDDEVFNQETNFSDLKWEEQVESEVADVCVLRDTFRELQIFPS